MKARPEVAGSPRVCKFYVYLLIKTGPGSDVSR